MNVPEQTAERRPSRHAIRDLETLADYRACVALQEEVWGAGFSERVPVAILKVAREVGGVAAGAFAADGRLDGFVFGMTGLDGDGGLVHWSDMLAVRPEARGSGLGVRLKEFQRRTVRARGVTRMLWTFDPLRARNAHLNLNILGAVVREYRRDMYGETDSALHRGIGTDRFVAVWTLEGLRPGPLPEPVATGSPEPDPLPPGALEVDDSGSLLRPAHLFLHHESEKVRVPIPSEIDRWLAEDLEVSLAWRAATREIFEHYFSRGYEARSLERGDPLATYVLERVGRAAPTLVPGPATHAS